MPRCFLYFFLFFLNVAKTKSSFFFLCILLLCSICVWVFFFFLNLKGIALYVYKLNEDKILFCINVHLRTIRAVATWC